MAAVVVGFSAVETLQIEGDAPTATPVVAPAATPPCDRMPIAIVPGDYDGDGVRDLWVQEACGGNWVSSGPEYAEGVVSTALVPTDPGPYEYVDYFDSPDGAIVLGGTTLFAYMLRRTNRQWSEAAWLSIPSSIGVRVTNLWLPLEVSDPVAQFLFQGHESLFVVAASESELVVTRTLTQIVAAPYVRPFEAFDHLAVPDPKDCPNIAMGIGLFGPDAGGVPRRLQMLRLEGAAYSVLEPPVRLDDVTTFSVAPREDGTSLLGVLGKRDGRELFALAALNDCADFETLAELEIEFNLETPPLPTGYDRSFVALTDAVRLVTFVSGGKVSFAHYDGFALRVISATQVGSSWQLAERRHEIHSRRDDSSFD